MRTCARMHTCLHHVHAVADDPDGCWPRFWDYALDKGPAGTSSALALLKLLSLTSSDGKCSHNTDLQVSLEDCVRSIVNCSDNSFHLGLRLHSCFRSPWSTS